MEELSQYVIDMIVSINYATEDHDNSVKSIIQNASKNAQSEIDSQVLDIIGGCYSMYYDENERSFKPYLTLRDGRRSFALEDLNGNDLDILRNVVQITGSSCIRTKFSHIVWLLNKDNRYGEIAVKGYLDEFQNKFDPENWVDCYKQISCAYHIVCVIGKKSNIFKQTLTIIDQKVMQLDGTDSSFLSLKLLRLIVKDVPKEYLSKYDLIMFNLANRNLHPTNENQNLADETFSVLRKLYVRMKKEEELNVAKGKYAKYYEDRAKCLAQNKDYIRSVHMLIKACELYNGIDLDKLLELRLLLEEWQTQAIKTIPTHKVNLDVKSTCNRVEQIFKGLSLTEAIVQFGRVAKIYEIDEVKANILNNNEKYVFTSIFETNLLNKQGQIIHKLPAIRDGIDSGNSNAMKKHMAHYIAEQRSIGAINVVVAYQCLSKYRPITEDALDFLMLDNLIVPKNRMDIIKQGLCMALNGKLYAAMHILLPQTENIFRNLVKMCGDYVTFLKEDGIEEYKPLSSLFKSDKLQECYDENIIFTFQSIMDEPTGENLRNLNAHGLLEPEVGYGAASLNFLSLVVFLLSLYGPKAYSIRNVLAKREQLSIDVQDKEDID